ncbi:MAG: YggS family pyridoxal phosphate-dependent enzyme [Pseudomonadota bacterium]
MTENSLIKSRLLDVEKTIHRLEQKYQRKENSVQLLAVSKTKPIDDILAAAKCGQTHFGENYVQESVDKIQNLASQNLHWHFIGPLQKNKTRLVAEHFSWIHTIERSIIAERIAAQRPENLSPIQVCIQVNIDGEASKSGVAPADIKGLAEKIIQLKNIKLRGLMAIPQASGDTTQQRTAFAKLRKQFELLNQNGFDLDTLSMGMSNDLDAAIAEGATIVRVGTAIFGKRN